VIVRTETGATIHVRMARDALRNRGA